MSAVLIEFPSELIVEVDKLAGGEANRTNYLVDLIEDQIVRQNQIAALKKAAGAWKDDDNSEMNGMDSIQFVEMLRSRANQRYEQIDLHRQDP